jgi:hypothetical protein
MKEEKECLEKIKSIEINELLKNTNAYALLLYTTIATTSIESFIASVMNVCRAEKQKCSHNIFAHSLPALAGYCSGTKEQQQQQRARTYTHDPTFHYRSSLFRWALVFAPAHTQKAHHTLLFKEGLAV